jgi:hypothetical protein
MISWLKQLFSSQKSKVHETPDKDAFLQDNTNENDNVEYNLVEMEDDGSIYLLFVDGVHGQEFVNEVEYLDEQFQRVFDESYIAFLNGGYGENSDYVVESTTIGELSPEYCSICNENKMYNSKTEEFYCPKCDKND